MLPINAKVRDNLQPLVTLRLRNHEPWTFEEYIRPAPKRRFRELHRTSRLARGQHRSATGSRP